jgi:RNA polymerase sigma-70 factor, ECF subfamily
VKTSPEPAADASTVVAVADAPAVTAHPAGAEAGLDTNANADAIVEDLVTRLGPAIYRTAFAILHDRAAAEDVVQETIVKAWTNLHTLQDPAALTSWVLRIAHNVSISALRKRRALPVAPDEMPEATLSGPDMGVRLEHKSAVNDVWGALSTLDELSRSIVVLREIEGLSYEEISRIVGIPLAAMKTRLFRARRQLAEQLKEWR